MAVQCAYLLTEYNLASAQAKANFVPHRPFAQLLVRDAA